jgi:DNA gyrase subunit A
LVSAREVSAKDDLMLFSSRGKLIRISISEIRETGRNASGVRLMNVDQGEKVVAVENLPAVDQMGQNGSDNSGTEPETVHCLGLPKCRCGLCV